ncbi:DUF7573 domain-containing protein [Natronomonas amylolytica]|uniref:DUF7573 domain-containing protein n=1 Tax=Natronomonas amylolytica TaxID=3108498 RepID=UPI0030094E3F
MRDRSLEEFASDSEDADDAAEAADDATAAASEPDPALSTYEWTSGGVACEECGTVVEKRWRNGDGTGEALVCADCKEW